MSEQPPPRRRSLLRRALTARGRSLEITRSGWLFIVVTLAVGFAAINSGSNLLHALFGAQMALIVGSGMLSESTVHRVAARRVPADTLHAGTPAPARIEIRNVHPRADVLSVSVEDDDRVVSSGACNPVFTVRIPAAGRITLTTSLTMQKRGRHRLPAAVLATRFPFGLFVKRRDLPTPAEVVVYPRVSPVAPEVSRHHQPGRGEMSGRAARVGEFYGLREYREGDDPRRMYWPAIARLARPVIREHEARGDIEVMLDLGPGTTGDPAFEREVERVASMAMAHLHEGSTAVGLRYGGEVVVPSGTGEAQRHRIMGFLALCGSVA